jgi:hypothetical protein
LATCGSELVRSKPFLITLTSAFTPAYRRRLKQVTVRPDDVWIITHPKEFNEIDHLIMLYKVILVMKLYLCFKLSRRLH